MSYLVDILKRQIKEAGLPEPVPEYRFHPRRRFLFDLCWPEYMLAVEVDGAIFNNGRHMRPSGVLTDCEKYTLAAIRHYRVLRIPSIWIYDGRKEVDVALSHVREALAPYLEAERLMAEIAAERPEWRPIEASRFLDGTWELLYETERGTVAIASRQEWEALRWAAEVQRE